MEMGLARKRVIFLWSSWQIPDSEPVGSIFFPLIFLFFFKLSGLFVFAFCDWFFCFVFPLMSNFILHGTKTQKFKKDGWANFLPSSPAATQFVFQRQTRSFFICPEIVYAHTSNTYAYINPHLFLKPNGRIIYTQTTDSIFKVYFIFPFTELSNPEGEKHFSVKERGPVFKK